MSAAQVSPSIGFLGIGAMGLPMAHRIHSAGLSVMTADVSAGQVRRAQDLGIPSSTDVRTLSGCSALLVIVATADQLLGLLDGELLGSDTKVQVVVVMSTVGVGAVQSFHNELAGRNIAVIDSPVTGGVAGAESGRLNLFLGGRPEDVDSVREALEPLGRLNHCGDKVGDGQAVKLVNQLLAASHLAVAAEAVNFARALGLDARTTLDLVSAGAGGSWMLTDRGPRLVQPATERPVRTHLSILAKDSALVLNAAQEAGFQASILEVVARGFRDALAQGLGSNDDSSIVDLTTEADTDTSR
jgi:3-hydroxyisobutyrate dehydrogenase